MLFRAAPVVRRDLGACAVCVALVVVASGTGGYAGADPAADALARMNELSRQAEQTTEEMYSAEIELEKKVAIQRSAEERSAADRLAADATDAELRRYQESVDDVAAAAYMGAPTNDLYAALTATSPGDLLDRMSAERAVSATLGARMAAYRTAKEAAAAQSATSARSADEAQLAAQQAAGVKADLQSKQSRLRAQIADVEAQYRVLTPEQRTALADPGPVPPAPPPPPPPPPAPEPPPGPEVLAAPAPAPASDGATVVVQAAMSRIGSPYSWGASGPDAFDCSGLIKWSFLQTGKSLPRSSQALAEGGQPVAVENVQPGDIVTFYSYASHAGIYIGDGKMVHSSTYGVPVKVDPITMAPIYNVRRY